MKKDPIHFSIRSMEKPSDCCICYEALTKTDNPLFCGHTIHLECVKKHFKPECPLCRAPLDIKVSGTVPLPFIPTDSTDFGDTEESEEEEDIAERYTSTRNIEDPGLAISEDLSTSRSRESSGELGDVNEVEFNHYFEREDFLPEFGNHLRTGKRRREEDEFSSSSSSEEIEYYSY